jgi:hypothetical protein
LNRKKYKANHLTLEQLQNISNPKVLFSKEDQEKFALMLGIELESPTAGAANSNA